MRFSCWGPVQRNTAAKVLWWLEADLDARGQQVLDLLGTKAGIAPGFQQPPGEVLGRAHTSGESLAKQAAALDQLRQCMREL